MRSLKRYLIVVFFLGFCTWGFSQSVIGTWKTIDDKSGKAKSILSVYMRGERLYAKVIKILEEGKENATCIECKGSLKDKPILGMQIINGLVQKGENEYGGGTILDPENGQSYRCRIWLNAKDPNQLMVRGYLAFFFRTQKWIRVTN